ncbi:hypothetical protein HG531_011785 [Fusarium graminearum]|nr:hypothetical protein HG531_011785 [Fusarium graminearum]
MDAGAAQRANLIHQALVALVGLSLDPDKNVLNILNNLIANGLIEEGRRKHLEDESSTALVILQNGLQHLVIGREKQGLENGVPGICLCFLVDDLQNSEDCSTLRESAGVQEPSQEKGAVSVGCQLHAVEGDGGSQHSLLVLSRMVALKTSSHRTSAVSALGDLPHASKHGLEDEIVVGSAELEAALKNIVAILVQEKRDSVWANVFSDQSHLGRGLADIDDFLGSPSAVLVNTDLSQVRGYLGQHGITKLVRAVLEQLLHHCVTQIVGRELGDLRKHIDGNVLDLSLRQALVVNPLADIPEFRCIMDPGMSRLTNGGDFLNERVKLYGGLKVASDSEPVLLRSTKLLDNLENVGCHFAERRSFGSRVGSGRGRRSLTSRSSGIRSLCAVLSLREWIRAGRREDSIMARSVGRRRWLGEVDADGASTGENFLAVHACFGRDGTLDPLKVDKTAVLVSENSGREDRTVRLEHLDQGRCSGGCRNAAQPKCTGRTLKTLLISAEKSCIAAVGSTEIDSSNSLRKIVIIFVVLQANFS